MRGKIIFVLVAIVLIFALGMSTGFSQEKEKATLDSTAIIAKLDEVLANQVEILAEFDEIKQELRIIKVRASR
jgi:uncharacterized membrane protein